ncbi:MAG: sulfatase-like hydrolase/transferase [Aromatoleum sp.]|nr:sulfatase-like hydrolase/transferase [Aromatoleum sp.]
MSAVRNVLFVMCDQLRRDFVSCYGGSTVATPSIDRIAAAGVRFDNAFVQSGVCGPSRMSYYTGRYVASHGATWNLVPLSAAEWTLGDHLRSAGRSAALCGKTHVLPDNEALARFGIEIESERGALLRQGGFVVVDRYDGHTPPGPESGYADWLRARGYDSADPWNDFVIAVEDGGRVASGWSLRNVHLPSRVKEEHSETAYMTDLALDWIRARGEAAWVLHLSYVKPHWPYVAPSPFHRRYRGKPIGEILRGPQDGTADEHPVVRAYRGHDECLTFARDDVVRHVRPAYMGLVAQVDYHIGRLLDALVAQGRMDDTLIVFTSDHGEFLGDRGLGEKELFYDEVVRVPFVIYDPDPRADATRGSADARFVEGIDVVPTVLDALGLPAARHRIEGHSLLRLTRGEAGIAWRDAAFCELDYGFRRARRTLGRGLRDCRAYMLRTAQWKYVHWQGFRPQLFDLAADPRERFDLGADPRLAAERRALHEGLFDWLASRKRRTTVDDARVEDRTDMHRRHGVHIGIW